MQAYKILENVYWVGAIDWELRNFHGYSTNRGSTYNAYLILGEKNILIDTVKKNFENEMIARIKSILDPAKIDLIIANHVEMDHTGALPKIMTLCQADVLASPAGVKGLEAHFGNNSRFKAIPAPSLQVGSLTLNFTETKMIHWPDNMVTYLPDKKILFSNDAFGQHLASDERTDTNYPLEILMEEAKKYYANIVFPYGEQVKKAMSSLAKLDIKIIAPSHGLIWKNNIPKIIKEYSQWMNNYTKNKGLIIFDSMWGSTKIISDQLHDVFESLSIPTPVFDLKNSHISDIMAEALDAKYICIGSPTLNNNILPTVAGFLTYLKGLSPKNRIGLAFGSYGWGGQSVQQIENILSELKWELLPPIKKQYIPDHNALQSELLVLKKIIEKYLGNS